MIKTWQIQKAKQHLSQLVNNVIAGHPQQIILQGNQAVVVITKHQYVKLINPKPSFVNFIQQSPLAGLELKITRSKF